MKRLHYELTQLLARNRDGAYSTQAQRRSVLLLSATQLLEAGYRDLTVYTFKGRHINTLLARWRTEGLTPGTLKNRLAALRWWAEKVGNPTLMATRNAHYGVPTRETVPRVSKAQTVTEPQLARVRDPYTRMTLQLQLAFGLRREEAIKIKPWQADRGDRLVLQGSWTKGGRPRDVPLTTLAQRDILDRAKAFVGSKGASLIPPDHTYAQQLHRYEGQIRQAGLTHMHGLRHHYAQALYEAEAGVPSPVNGGPLLHELAADQRARVRHARQVVSTALGHGRPEVTATYVGSRRSRPSTSGGHA